jgi:hypothetical protein
LSFGFETAVCADMDEIVSTLYQNATNEQPSMAVRRIFFTAHQSNPKLRHAALQASDSALKKRICGAFAIQDASARVVVIVASGSPPKFFSEEKIPDPRRRKVALQSGPIKLRSVFGMGRRARIDDDFDLVSSQQANKCLERVRGMADGVNGTHGWLLIAFRIPPLSSRQGEINANKTAPLLE